MKKLLPSSSISSSSSSTTATTTTTTTASFGSNMCNSKSGTACCLAGILRRILCSRSLPTHPSDHTTETTSIVCDNKHQELTINNSNDTFAAPASNPGVVARLMGLESLPGKSGITMQVNATSISRSRSMNSMEFRGDHQKGELHRKVKSSLSVREIPTFIEPENEEFFVLSFENGSEAKEGRCNKWRRCEVGFAQKPREQCERKEKCRREKVMTDKKEAKEEEITEKTILRVLKEEELSNRISDKPTQEICNGGKIQALLENKRSNWMVHSNGSKPRNKKKKKKKQLNRCASRNTETECSSEDSSPVSVLEFDQFIIDPSEEDTLSGEPNSRRKLSAELENCNQLSQFEGTHLINNDQNSKKSEVPCQLSTRKLCQTQDHTSLAKAQVVGSNWVQRKVQTFEDIEGICTDFGLLILEQLVEELVDQLDSLALKSGTCKNTIFVKS